MVFEKFRFESTLSPEFFGKAYFGLEMLALIECNPENDANIKWWDSTWKKTLQEFQFTDFIYSKGRCLKSREKEPVQNN